jgi:hypothetical protein
MFTIRLRIDALLLLTIVLLAAGGLFIPRGAHGDAAPAPAAPKVPKELLKKRLVEAATVWEIKMHMFKLGGPRAMPIDEFSGWSERLLEAELALAEKKEDRMKALKAHLDRTGDIKGIANTLVKSGAVREADAHAATYERLHAEIRYFEATGEAPPSPLFNKKD